MPRLIHKLVSKNNVDQEILLSSLSFVEAYEEALDTLGWRLESQWDEPYNSMYQDEHMMSLHSQTQI